MSVDAIYHSAFFQKMSKRAPGLSISLASLAARYDYARETNETRAQLRNNLRRAFPELEPQSLDKLLYRHKSSLYRVSALYKYLRQANGTELLTHADRDVRYLNRDTIDRVIRHPGPVVILSPHYGTFLSASLKLFRDIGVNKRFNFFFDDPEKNPGNADYPDIYARLGENATSLLNNRRAIVSAIKALQKGEVLTMMPDVYDTGNNHVAVPFFGGLTNAMTGTAFFALKTRAMLVPVYGYPDGGMRSVLDVQEPIPLSQAQDFDQALYETTASIFANIEAQLRRLPEHWIYWKDLHRRYPCAARIPAPADGAWLSHFETLLAELRAQTPSLTPLLEEIERKTKTLSAAAP